MLDAERRGEGVSMWVVLAFVIAASIGIAVVLAATRRGSAPLNVEPWLLYDTAKLHVAIMGSLAGFAVTGIVLIAGLARGQAAAGGPALNTVVVMFTVAYFYYVGNAFLISYLPHRDPSGDFVPRVHFSLASSIEYRTLFVSWFALMPLLRTYGLQQTADILAILLPISLLIGSVIIAMAADGLGLILAKETYLSLAIGTVLGIGYAGLVRLLAPGLASEYATIQMTLIIFCINGLGYALAAATALAPRYPSIERFYARQGRRLVIVDMQLTMSALAFLWMAVIRAI
jgi:hypothetical protein